MGGGIIRRLRAHCNEGCWKFWGGGWLYTPSPCPKSGRGIYPPPLYPPSPGSPPMAQWLLLKLSILHTNYIPSDTNSGNSQAKCMCLITELVLVFKWCPTIFFFSTVNKKSVLVLLYFLLLCVTSTRTRTRTHANVLVLVLLLVWKKSMYSYPHS